MFRVGWKLGILFLFKNPPLSVPPPKVSLAFSSQFPHVHKQPDGILYPGGVFLYFLSHLGSSLVDHSEYLLSVTSYNAILEKGNNELTETGFALEQLVETSLALGLVPTQMPVTELGSLSSYDGK